MSSLVTNLPSSDATSGLESSTPPQGKNDKGQTVTQNQAPTTQAAQKQTLSLSPMMKSKLDNLNALRTNREGQSGVYKFLFGRQEKQEMQILRHNIKKEIHEFRGAIDKETMQALVNLVKEAHPKDKSSICRQIAHEFRKTECKGELFLVLHAAIAEAGNEDQNHMSSLLDAYVQGKTANTEELSTRVQQLIKDTKIPSTFPENQAVVSDLLKFIEQCGDHARDTDLYSALRNQLQASVAQSSSPENQLLLDLCESRVAMDAGKFAECTKRNEALVANLVRYGATLQKNGGDIQQFKQMCSSYAHMMARFLSIPTPTHGPIGDKQEAMHMLNYNIYTALCSLGSIDNLASLNSQARSVNDFVVVHTVAWGHVLEQVTGDDMNGLRGEMLWCTLNAGPVESTWPDALEAKHGEYTDNILNPNRLGNSDAKGPPPPLEALARELGYDWTR
ncbi:MAG: hypothetical protein LBF43_02760 [Puniceicoccales bacterium]|jgi:hypothetical protein|nr:hypothetical protein [Puniceicoccales bacterium]